MEVKKTACDVYDHEEYPHVAFDDVKQVTIDITVGVDGDQILLGSKKVLCKKARERLVKGIERLLKPPAKREKELDPGAPGQIGGAQV